MHRYRRMRTPHITALTSAAIASLCSCTPSSPPHGDPASAAVRDAVIGIERQAWEAWKHKDAAFFRNTLLPTAAYVSATGVSTREQMAHEVETLNCTVDRYSLQDEQVRSISRDVALLTLRAMSDVTCNGQSVHADAWSSTLFVRDGDSWKVSFHQETDAQH